MTRFYAKRCGLTDSQYLELRATILFKQDFKCNHCGKDLSGNGYGNGDYELSHKEKNLKLTNEWNCEVLCPDCHSDTDPQRRTGRSWVETEEVS
jgi:5-methylcytosine-specific restriction endonuclease McrA